jgi:hypothetical protein
MRASFPTPDRRSALCLGMGLHVEPQGHLRRSLNQAIVVLLEGGHDTDTAEAIELVLAPDGHTSESEQVARRSRVLVLRPFVTRSPTRSRPSPNNFGGP